MDYKEKLNLWLESDIIDDTTKEELRAIVDEKEIEDRFYKELEFGTGGLRGIIGAGDNRLNFYTVGKATEGLARYLNKKYKENVSVCIAFDSRNMSKEFAERAALVLGGNGIKAYLFESLRPTPELSFGVRELKCKAGIVITASHNPKEYNGYKVYGNDGCQITDEAAKTIINEIGNVNYKDIKLVSREEALEKDLLNIIGEEIDNKFVQTLKGHTIRKKLVEENAKNLKIIYTPIHGTGLMPVKRVLTELGYTDLHIVEEQATPDGNFPTAPYPNPEDKSVFKIALDMAKTMNPDIILGTDPDADRIGAIVKDSTGEYRVLTGNQVGALLTHYILSSYKELGELPKNGAVIKTIVTTEMVRGICNEYNVELFDVLTGFKYIGEMMTSFQETGKNTFLFGFEESYGCLFGDHARDKDAIIGAQMVAEMTLYYKTKNKSLYEAYVELCDKYGYFKEELQSVTLKGKEGAEKIQSCLESLRKNPIEEVNGVKVKTFFDYKESIEKDLVSGEVREIKLPKSNVLKYILTDGSWFVVRPSGTEPKIKFYLSVIGNSIEDSEEKMSKFKACVNEKIGLN